MKKIDVLNSFIEMLNRAMDFIRFYHKLKYLINQKEKERKLDLIDDLIKTFKSNYKLVKELDKSKSLIFERLFYKKTTDEEFEWAKNFLKKDLKFSIRKVDKTKNYLKNDKYDLFYINLKKMALINFYYISLDFTNFKVSFKYFYRFVLIKKNKMIKNLLGALKKLFKE
ncbi:hypothetical protein A0H76_451 [Hepatospora eriocheir]|uniref:Uncharacterized protein n=1 Tax=Hepatospora eriocheir TaxID=1081669 RepID=A0A1X0Q9W5_9MICR|nr:hypothetical protein A0H76_451 [Hepatospora eriocheir]